MAAGIIGVAVVAWPLVFLIPIGGITFSLAWPGQYLVQPNEALVLILFGRYKGTVNRPGWHLVEPLHPHGIAQDLAAGAQLHDQRVQGQ